MSVTPPSLPPKTRKIYEEMIAWKDLYYQQREQTDFWKAVAQGLNPLTGLPIDKEER